MPKASDPTTPHTLPRRALLRAVGLAGAAVGSRPGSPVRRHRRPPGTRRATDHDHDAAAGLRSRRGADDVLHGPGRPHRRARVQRPCASPTRPSSGSGPARCGRGAGLERPGTLSSSGATSPTTGRCAGSRTTAASPSSALPSNNSNGNTFDFQGRQLSCEHLTRRVVRYEHDGSITILADKYRRQAAELAQRRRRRIPTAATGSPIRRTAASSTRARRTRRAGRATLRPAQEPRWARPPEIGDSEARAADQLLPRRSERAGRSRRQRRPGPGSERALLLAGLQEALRRQHRQGPGRHRAGRQGRHVRLRRRQRQQARPTASSSPTSWSTASSAGRTACAATSTATSGCSSNAGRAVGYSGVTVWTPDGKLIGRIRLPEVCGNVCFGGPKRNRLFMAAQPVALRGLRRHAGRGAGLSDPSLTLPR